MTGTYDSWLVLLSLILSTGASFVALSLAARVHFVTRKLAKYWLIGGGISMGLGIWSMHFVGMLAFHLPIPIAYDISLTAISILLAIAASILALFTIRKGKKDFKYLIMSAFLMGSGVAAMHYTGMAAMDMFPPIQYKPSLVIASLVIAYVASYIALKLSFMASEQRYVIVSKSRLVAACVMGAGIASMHYTAMYAAIFDVGSVCRALPDGIAPGTLSTLIVLGVVIILNFTLGLLVFDMKLAEKDHALLYALKQHNEDLLIQTEKLAEEMTEELRESARKDHLLATIAEQSADAIFTRDMQGKILSWNMAAENILGYSRNEVIGKAFNELCKNVDCIYTTTPEKLRAGSANSRTFETKLELREGQTIEAFIRISPLLDKDGEVVGEISILRDITEQKKKDEILRRTQKMDALGKLTGGIAHDFNNMLGVMLGYSELLQDHLKDDPKRNKYLKEIIHAGERAKTLTTKLLAFSRKRPSSPESTNLNKILLDEKHMLEKTLTARIELIYELEDDLWPVVLDKGDFEDALLNMCINSMHAIADKGRLTLTTRNIHMNETDVSNTALEAGDHVLLSVTDTGAGMDETTLNNLFDPFFSTKGDKGTGLGMSQVYGFVQQSKGDIHVYSEPGHGTRVAIYLPRDILNVASVVDRVDESQGQSLVGSELILVVDDEPALRELAEEILVQQGYRVKCAESAEAAIKILASESIDLMLSDVIMPGMDGYQLAEYVQQHYPHIKIQMASGFTDENHIKFANDALHQHRLQKPFTSKLLLVQIRKLLDS